jgi:hypothetical protein
LFDRYIGAIQRASEASGYVLDRFELPWNEKEEGEATKVANVVLDRLEIDRIAGTETKPDSQLLSHERSPGIILFRGRDNPSELLVVFLIGETPTAGVQKGARRGRARSLDS